VPRPRPRKPATAEREGHTVYLRQAVWHRLDSEYAKRRAATRGGMSKIEFVERVLEAGLDALPLDSREPPSKTPGAQASTP
jgi:hypothetical protein